MYILLKESCRVILLLALLLLAGCKANLQTYNHHSPCLCRPIPVYTPPETHMRLALVLGAGGARGMAHVGVLEELEKAKIPIDLIVGCSAGSLIGSLYATNPNASEIKQDLALLRKKDFIEMDLFMCCHALCHGKGLKRFLLKHLGDTHFEEAKIPLVVVATDLASGELVTLGSGHIAPAVHASCAYPIFLSPVKIYDRILIDGGVLNPIPVSIAKQHNVDVVVAVNINASLSTQMPSHLLGVATRCSEIIYLNLSNTCSQEADVIIKPELGEVGTFADGFNEHSYLAGKKAALAAIPAIQKALEAAKKRN